MSTLILRPNSDDTQYQNPAMAGGTNYALIDEATKDEADYTYLAATAEGNAQLDLYGFPDHSSESGTINSVTVKAYLKYILTGTCTNNATFNPSVKISSTTYASGEQNLTSSTALYSYAWTTNPATSSAWTWSEIDALLAGDYIKNGWVDKSNRRTPYKYQLWVEVDYTEGGAAKAIPTHLFHKPFRHMLIR